MEAIASARETPHRPSIESPMKWYTVYTKPRHERAVCERLLHGGFDPWLPLATVWRTSKGGPRRASTPLFPRYLFVRCYLDMYNHLAVITTPGVIGDRRHRRGHAADRIGPHRAGERLSLGRQRAAPGRKARAHARRGDEARPDALAAGVGPAAARVRAGARGAARACGADAGGAAAPRPRTRVRQGLSGAVRRLRVRSDRRGVDRPGAPRARRRRAPARAEDPVPGRRALDQIGRAHV